MRGRRIGISDVIAEVILVAVAVAIAIAVAGWLIAHYQGSTKQELYFPHTVTLNSPLDRAYYPMPGIATIEVWSEEVSSGQYRVYYRVTALRELSYIEVHAHLRTSQGLPRYAGNPDTVWRVENVRAGWYSEQFWQPLLGSEYPVRVSFEVYLKEK